MAQCRRPKAGPCSRSIRALVWVGQGDVRGHPLPSVFRIPLLHISFPHFFLTWLNLEAVPSSVPDVACNPVAVLPASDLLSLRPQVHLSFQGQYGSCPHGQHCPPPPESTVSFPWTCHLRKLPLFINGTVFLVMSVFQEFLYCAFYRVTSANAG